MDLEFEKQVHSLIDAFADEVESFPRAKVPEWTDEDIFSAIVLDLLAENGEIDDAVMCPYRGQGLQLNAYTISDDHETVDIYVSIYGDPNKLSHLSNQEVDAALMRGLSVYRKAAHDLHKSFEKDTDTYGFAVTLSKYKKTINKVSITLLTNFVTDSVVRKDVALGNTTISFAVFDIERIFKSLNGFEASNPVVVDFLELNGASIPCIENHSSPVYSSYLAILDGTTIALLYEKFGTRLLERNIRSFLQVRGAVNKGIRNTLRDEPEMFLAYNNGISVTAERVTISRDVNGKPSIDQIYDMQVVNGGQTTASIHSAYKDKKLDFDLSKVFVQMKLSVIRSADDVQTIVPRISEYANTQNRIQIADFSANDPFHREVEALSMRIAVPSSSGKKHKYWFYERSRGQYNDYLSRLPSPAERRLFRTSHLKFAKTDLAKYENTWDQLPHLVSTGAQKNFRLFTLRIQQSKHFLPDDLYFKRLVAKAILSRRTEELVSLQGYGGYRANIVTYTLALLSFHTEQRIDLTRIWTEQQLSKPMEKEIIEASKLVHGFITEPPGGANISEWCKKEKCWEALKALPFALSDELRQELVDVGKPSYTAGRRAQNLEDPVGSELDLIDKVAEIPAPTWFSLARWAKETDNFEGWQRGIVYSVGTRISRKRKPTYKQSVYAWEVYNRATNLGFKGEEK